jgi:ribosomal protein S18 acetylase RimI-like enzyme
VTAVLITVEAGAARDAWISLLGLADEPEPLRAYVHEGVLYGIVDEESGKPLAAVLVVGIDDHFVELRAVAVDEYEQGHGLGTWIVSEVCDRLRGAGRRVLVGTANSGIRQLGFYQRLGFRLSRVERDFFTPERGYPVGLSENGIPTRDMVWMELES